MFKVKDKYRKNKLSFIPGGHNVIIKYKGCKLKRRSSKEK